MIKTLILISCALLLKRTYTQVVMDYFTYYYVSPTTATGCYMDVSISNLDCQSAPSTAKLFLIPNTTGVVEIMNSDGYYLAEASTGTTRFNLINSGTLYSFGSVITGKYISGTYSWPSTTTFKFCSTAWDFCDGSIWYGFTEPASQFWNCFHKSTLITVL
jgi:hypothetical protein